MIDKKVLQTIRNLFYKTLSYEQQLQGVKVQSLTEYTRQQVTFRCNSNYRNEGSWYDYAMFAWEQSMNSKSVKDSLKVTSDWNKEILH